MQKLAHYDATPLKDDYLDWLLTSRGFGARFNESLVTAPYDRIFRLHSEIRRASLEGLASLHGATPVRVSSCYTVATCLNAAAIRTPKQFCIAFPIGTVALLYDLFFRMLGTDSVFPELGHPDPEKVPRYARIPTDAGDLIAEADNPLGVSYIPPARERRAMAEYLVVIVHDLLFAHEHQHIDGGHLHFLSREHQKSSIFEFGDAPETQDEELLFQALELDADAASVRWSLKILMDARRNLWRYDPCLRGYLQEPEMALRAWLFALITLFRLTHEHHVRSGEPFRKHPPPLMRLAFMRPMVGYLFSGFPIRVDPLSLFEIVFDEVQRGFCAVSRQLPRREGFSTVSSKPFRDHMNAVISTWRRIQPELTALCAEWGGSNSPEVYTPYVK
jgi:hypothetical protein